MTFSTYGWMGEGLALGIVAVALIEGVILAVAYRKQRRMERLLEEDEA